MNLTTKEIAYLFPSFTERTVLSLFSNIKATPDGSEHQKLVEKGIIQGNGYAPEALEILLQIANPKQCARVIIKNEFFMVEKYTYRNKDKILLADNKSGEFVFSRIGEMGDVTIGLSELFGMSSIKTADVGISLQKEEMIVLLAIIDLYRKNTLLNYAGESHVAEDVSEKEITGEISNGFKNGLVRILVNNYGCQMPDTKDVSRLLAILSDKKCLFSTGGGYKLAEDYAALATSFLVMDSVVLYEAFEVLPNGDIPVDGGLSITAGVHDIITFIFDGDTIGLYSFSAFQMLSTIEKILACPALMDEMKQVVPPPVQSAPPVQDAPPPIQAARPAQAAAPMQTPPPFSPAAQAVRPIQGAPGTQPAGNTWRCACGRVNTGNFCAVCGKRKI